jgi:transcription initiation factor TFIIIB Brf1 subunit/transcription initiation factor TFIIB
MLRNYHLHFRMEQHNIDKAFNIYKLAFEHRLTKGRRNDLVIAASLYITCRCDGGNSQCKYKYLAVIPIFNSEIFYYRSDDRLQ